MLTRLSIKLPRTLEDTAFRESPEHLDFFHHPLHRKQWHLLAIRHLLRLSFSLEVRYLAWLSLHWVPATRQAEGHGARNASLARCRMTRGDGRMWS